MAERRYFTWHIESLVGDNTNLGETYIADRAYRPIQVYAYAKVAPDAGHMEFDILDDGTSIFTSGSVVLPEGQNSEDLADDFGDNAEEIAQGSIISCNLTAPNGAKGVTIVLVAMAENDEAETDI